MSVIDEVLAANEIYSRTHELRKLTPRPERKLAVLTCMDTRLSIRTLGLKTGDAHIIRNAGGSVTEDTLRSLVVSHYLLGTEEIMVINHTDTTRERRVSSVTMPPALRMMCASPVFRPRVRMESRVSIQVRTASLRSGRGVSLRNSWVRE